MSGTEDELASSEESAVPVDGAAVESDAGEQEITVAETVDAQKVVDNEIVVSDKSGEDRSLEQITTEATEIEVDTPETMTSAPNTKTYTIAADSEKISMEVTESRTAETATTYNGNGTLYRFTVPGYVTYSFLFSDDNTNANAMFFESENLEAITSDTICHYGSSEGYTDEEGNYTKHCLQHDFENSGSTDKTYYLWVETSDDEVSFTVTAWINSEGNSGNEGGEEGGEVDLGDYADITTLFDNAAVINIDEEYKTKITATDKYIHASTGGADRNVKAAYGTLLKLEIPVGTTVKLSMKTTENRNPSDATEENQSVDTGIYAAIWYYDTNTEDESAKLTNYANNFRVYDEYEYNATYTESDEYAQTETETYGYLSSNNEYYSGIYYIWLYKDTSGDSVDITVNAKTYVWYEEYTDISELAGNATKLEFGTEYTQTVEDKANWYRYDLYDNEVSLGYGTLSEFTVKAGKGASISAIKECENSELMYLYKKADGKLVYVDTINITNKYNYGDIFPDGNYFYTNVVNNTDADEEYYIWATSTVPDDELYGTTEEIKLKIDELPLLDDVRDKAQVVSDTTDVEYKLYNWYATGDGIVTCLTPNSYDDGYTRSTYQVIKLEGKADYAVTLENTSNLDIKFGATVYDPSKSGDEQYYDVGIIDGTAQISAGEKGVYLFLPKNGADSYSKTDDDLKSGKAVVHITKVENTKKITSIKISAPDKTTGGDTFDKDNMQYMTAAELVVDIEPKDATNQELIWSSSDEDALSTAGNLITDKSLVAKEVTITATAKDGSGVSASITIKLADYESNSEWIKKNTKIGDTYYYVLNVGDTESVDLKSKYPEFLSGHLGYQNTFYPQNAGDTVWTAPTTGGNFTSTDTYINGGMPTDNLVLNITNTAKVVYYYYDDENYISHKMAFVISRTGDTGMTVETAPEESEVDVSSINVGTENAENLSAKQTVTTSITLEDNKNSEVGGDEKKVKETTVETKLELTQTGDDSSGSTSAVTLTETIDNTDTVKAASVNVTQDRMSDAAMTYALNLTDDKNSEYEVGNSGNVSIDKIDVTYSDDTSDSVISKDVLEKLGGVSNDVILNVVKKDADGNEEYSWSFDSGRVSKDKIETKGLNTKLSVNEVTDEDKAVKTAMDNLPDGAGTSRLVNFAHSGNVTGNAKVRIKVGSGYKAGDKVFFYYVNRDADGNVTFTERQKPVVDDDGFIEVGISHCSDYIVMEKGAPLYVSDVSLDKTSLALETGKSQTLKATVTPEDADETGITWTSSNTKVATVDANGKVTAVAAGNAVIKATAKDGNGASASCNVTVTQKSTTDDKKDDKNDAQKDDKKDNANSSVEETVKNVTVSYKTHVQSKGWETTWSTNGALSGTVGNAKRLEAIDIKVSGNSNLGIQYTTHCQSYGWLPWSADGEMSGTSGEAKRLEAIKIQLTGADKDKYDVYYRVHAQSYGWLAWAKNGAAAGTSGMAKRLEAIQIVVVKKGTTINKNMGNIVSATTSAYVTQGGSSAEPTVSGADTPNVKYKTHVQSYGWQGWKYNGTTSGTSGEAKRLEGIEIELANCPYSGGISYKTHIQSKGWETAWKSDGDMSGTSGEAKRLEAIQIKLTGEMAEHYDVYYRVHAQTYGWLAWAKNGESAGTSGQAKRLEAIQIVLVPKGSAAPSASYGGVTSINTMAYVPK